VRGVNYLSKRCSDDGAVSSADEEQEQVVDAASDAAAKLDENAENRSENPASQFPKTQSTAASSSAVKKKRDVVSFLHLCVLCNDGL